MTVQCADHATAVKQHCRVMAAQQLDHACVLSCEGGNVMSVWHMWHVAAPAGDGAGVGKGRQIAGVILDSFARGRRWVDVTSCH